MANSGICVLTCAALLLFTQDAAAFIYDEWQQYSLRSRETFIAGVGEGFSWANSEAREAGHPIYCAPHSFSLTSGQYLALLDGYAKRNLDQGSLDQGIGLLKLFALKEAYPFNQP